MTPIVLVRETEIPTATTTAVEGEPTDDFEVDATTLATVQEVAERLDGIRHAIAALGPATLLAELHDMPNAVLCDALEDLLVAAEWTLARLKV